MGNWPQADQQAAYSFQEPVLQPSGQLYQPGALSQVHPVGMNPSTALNFSAQSSAANLAKPQQLQQMQPAY